jgi:hypothetical protein
MDSIGGAQIHVHDTSLWLKRNGRDPLVVTGARGPICEELIDRPSLRSAMGEKARASYEARFTIEHMLRPTLGITRSVLAANARIRSRAGDQAVARSPAEF